MSPQQVFDWRRAARRALTHGEKTVPSFVPIVPEPSVPMPGATDAAACPSPSIEIQLAGAVLRIKPGSDEALLTIVLRAVRASAA